MHEQPDSGQPVRLEIVYRDPAGKTISRPMDCPPTVKIADLGVRAGVPGHGRVTGVRLPGTQVGLPPHYTVAEAVPSGESVIYLDVEWDPAVPPAAHPFVDRVRVLRDRVNAAIPDYPPASWYGMALLIGVALGVLLFLPQGNGTRNPGEPDRVVGPTPDGVTAPRGSEDPPTPPAPETPVIVGITPRPDAGDPASGGEPGTGQGVEDVGDGPDPAQTEVPVQPEPTNGPGDDEERGMPPVTGEPEDRGTETEPPAMPSPGRVPTPVPPSEPADPLELLPPPTREAVAERVARAETELRDGANPELAEDAGQIWQDARRIGDRALERRALVVLKRVARTREMPFLLAAAHRGERALRGRTRAEITDRIERKGK